MEGFRIQLLHAYICYDIERCELVVKGFRIQLLHAYIKYNKGFVDHAIMALSRKVANIVEAQQ